MKRILLTACAVMALTAPGYAQDKSGGTYSPQPSEPTPVYRAPAATTTNTTIYEESGSSPLTGAYIGAYGGYGWTDVETDIAGADDFDVNGWDYGLFAGYKFDEFMGNSMGMNAAIEAFYGWSNADDDDDIVAASVEKDHEWGINFRPGLSFLSMGTAINPYGIIGYRRTNFDASAAGVSDDEDFDGLDLGIGTELVAWGNVGMRIDYTHTFYEENGGVDPDEDDIRVGLAYHF